MDEKAIIVNAIQSRTVIFNARAPIVTEEDDGSETGSVDTTPTEKTGSITVNVRRIVETNPTHARVKIQPHHQDGGTQV